MKNPPLFCIMNFKTIFKDAIYTNEQLDILSKYDNVKILRGFEHLEPLDATAMFYQHFFLNKYENKIYRSNCFNKII